MTLAEYRKAQNLTFADLAVKLELGGKNPARTAQRYAKGERVPSRAMVREIARLTENAVTHLDWLDAPIRTAA